MRLGVDHLDDLATGAVFLATGGGGDPHVATLTARAAITEHGPVDVIPPEELDDDALIVTIGSVGAPSAGLELLSSVDDPSKAVQAYQAHVGRKVDALVAFEIGGANSLVPVIAAAVLGLPLVDGDGMGRALPEAQMITFAIDGVGPTPSLVLDYAGNTATFETDTSATYERHVRALAAAMGGMVTAVEYPMTGSQLKASVVPSTVSFAIELGRVLRAHHGRASEAIEPLRSVFADSIFGDFVHLFSGKVVDYASSLVGGYDIGQVTIESFEPGHLPLVIDVKNEFLIARIGDKVVGTVPDLITMVDDETTTPINAERLRYGQRVSVFGVGAPAFFRTPEALPVVEPRAFGFDLDYQPLDILDG